ncbi:response regulator [Massilia sp. H-1]|nr:response regulator [Massilia sp. H-1]
MLLLDDDTFTLDLLADMLGEIGQVDVRRQSDARSALQVLGCAAWLLLICDLSMPDMDGIEFIHAAAGAGFRGHVMLLSGMDSGVRRAAERLARAHGLQVLGAYKKPISCGRAARRLGPAAGEFVQCDDTFWKIGYYFV